MTNPLSYRLRKTETMRYFGKNKNQVKQTGAGIVPRPSGYITTYFQIRSRHCTNKHSFHRLVGGFNEIHFPRLKPQRFLAGDSLCFLLFIQNTLPSQLQESLHGHRDYWIRLLHRNPTQILHLIRPEDLSVGTMLSICSR